MKLIIAGASGFVATEVIRQSLSMPSINSVIALARRPVSAPDNLAPGADTSKLQSAVVKDYDEYSEEVKKHFANADACIWSVAITPSKSKAFDFEVVRKVCQTNTIIGMKAMIEARGNSTTPFRFLYMSGVAAERDQTKTPTHMPQYSLMRGETETQVLALAKEYKDVEAAVAKPGLITGPGKYMVSIMATVLSWAGIVPNIGVAETAAAMLNQVENGFEKEPLMNDDLAKIGSEILNKAKE
ncbi:hypothetical protein BT63DRAFT_422752 [Microthyrium microscopicum]|uniref:NAD(P)-binding domain-containing protein n=1 Tax=Microthyrium microscopicum TaxID=703497 RepID=A0A6A6ULC5_9PEZI|nr:hypothetical protein BT63DRAFT_422752 [Microthyrium microscopicum]